MDGTQLEGQRDLSTLSFWPAILSLDSCKGTSYCLGEAIFPAPLCAIYIDLAHRKVAAAPAIVFEGLHGI